MIHQGQSGAEPESFAPRPGDDRIKVLYILGHGRSGTTLLSRILGQVEGFFSIGEIFQIWERNLIGNRFCGCGSRFRDCEIWRAVFDQAFGGFDGVDVKGMIRAWNSMMRTRHLAYFLLPGHRARMQRHLAAYLQTLERLYVAIASVTSAKVIVDPSKYPTYAYLLNMIPGLDLSIVHLVRDPRGTAYSWQKVKPQPDGDTPDEIMGRMSPAFSTGLWIAWNIAGEAMWRSGDIPYYRIRYEDFIRHPREEVKKMVQLTGEGEMKLPFVSEHEVTLGPDHSLSGNPNRFERGAIRLRLDDSWKERMRLRDRLLVSAMTLPMRRRYRYP